MKLAKFLKAMLAVGVVAACVLGISACTNGDGSNGGVAATVNGVNIPEEKVTNTVQTVRAQSGLDSDDAWGTFLVQNNMTPESVREQIINSLIEQELVKEGAASLGITVDSTEIDTYVQSMKANFDSDDKWKEALTQAGFTEEEYRQSIESSLMQQQLGKYFEEKATVSDDDVLQSAKTYAPYYNGAKRSSHILIGVDNVNDAAAMEEARSKAQDIINRINSGEISFEDAAKEYSTDTASAEKGGDVGWDVTASFAAEYQAALKDLERDQISGPVDSQFGVHIIKVTDVFEAPEEITSLDQLPQDFQTTIKEMASSVKANSDYTAWVEELKGKADIKINDMPKNVPYNIDLTKYQSAASSSSAAAASSEGSQSASSGSASGSAESTSSSTESTSSASSGSAESGSAS